MNKKPWFVIIGLALLLPVGFCIFSLCIDVPGRSLSTSPAKIATSPEHHAALETVTFDVHSMTCASCPFIVKKTLEKAPGVTKATADFDTKTARVMFDKEKTNIPALLKALKNRGYPSSVLDSS